MKRSVKDYPGNVRISGSNTEGTSRRTQVPFYKYIVLAVIFAFICAIYSVVMIRLVASKETSADTSGDSFTERTVTVQAVRGEIYDRNGKLLVKNKYSYSLIFDYDAMASSYSEQNSDIIEAFELIDSMDIRDSMPETKSVLHGVYPYLSFDRKMLLDDITASRLSRIKSELELNEDADCDTFVAALANKYRMLNSDGTPKYTNEQMTDLLRVRYEMEAIRFAPGEPYTLLEDIGQEVMTRAEELNIRGTEIRVSYTREYCYPGYASQILGRISRIYAENAEYYTSKGYPITAVVGTDGCEAAFEEYLRGMDGTMKITEDADGNTVSTEMVKEPEAGLDVYLTIDINLQIAAEQALEENIEYVQTLAAKKTGSFDGEDCDCGALVAQKVNTGEILVIASYPSYDLSTFSKDYASLLADSRTPLFNRALEGTYAPGSTFKVGVAAAGLIEKPRVSGEAFNGLTLIKTEGVYKYYDDYQPACWLWNQSHRSHGSINVTEAIRVSCNCFFYELGRILGIDTIDSYCRQFGLGQSTGIELPESKGILASPGYAQSIGRTWTGGDTLQASIGQSYNKFTPIQLAGYIATVVNGGTRYSAHLLKEVKTFTGDTEYTPDVKIAARVEIDSYTVNVLRNAMSKVVDENNSVTAFDNFAIKVGGKTGTAQVDGQSSNAVFVCFAPLSEPDISVACVLERGATGANAARSARAVMEEYFFGGD